MKDLIHVAFSLGKERRSCEGCQIPTFGYLKELNGAFYHVVCPRCRDTKHIFSKVVGIPRNDCLVISTRSLGKGGNVPASLQLPPMLCRAFKDVKPSLQKVILEDPSWIASVKYDGVRCLAYFLSDHVYFLSRNKSKGTGEYRDITEQIPHLAVGASNLSGTVLDGEIIFSGEVLDTGTVQTDSLLGATVALLNMDSLRSVELQNEYGQLHYLVFDCLRHRGLDVRGLPLDRRIELRNEVVDQLPSPPVFLEDHVLGDGPDKARFYQKVIAGRGEGVVYKDLLATYAEKENARPLAFVKRKARYYMKAFVTGYKAGKAGHTGLVGSLEFSVLDSVEPRVVAYCSNLDLETRKKMTDEDGTLRLEYYDQVYLISFQEFTVRSKRGRHAVIESDSPLLDQKPEVCDGSTYKK